MNQLYHTIDNPYIEQRGIVSATLARTAGLLAIHDRQFEQDPEVQQQYQRGFGWIDDDARTELTVYGVLSPDGQHHFRASEQCITEETPKIVYELHPNNIFRAYRTLPDTLLSSQSDQFDSTNGQDHPMKPDRISPLAASLALQPEEWHRFLSILHKGRSRTGRQQFRTTKSSPMRIR